MARRETPLSIERVTVKNFKPAAGLSQETLAFSASIYINGRRAGQVTNGGTGGCNGYAFNDRARHDAFMAYARAWGEEHRQTFEPEDALIEQLCEDYEYRRLLRRAIAAGAPALLLIRKQPVWYLSTPSTDPPDYYDESYAVALRDGEDPATRAQREQAAAWRIGPVESA